MYIATTMDQYIKEHVTNDIIWLKRYLDAPAEERMDYLPEEHPYEFDEFISRTGMEFDRPEDMEDYELVEWLRSNDIDMYNNFAEYLYDRINNRSLHIPDQEYPSWSYFDNRSELIRNQWLVHFTDEADDIAKDGFKYGVEDISKLGLTTYLSDFDKKHGGYNFAFTIGDYKKYAKDKHGNSYKYGDEVVIFRASGIRIYHNSDEEYQTIFYGNTAEDIIPIKIGDNNEWCVYGNTGRVLYNNEDLDNVITWVISNFDQYRKKLR